MYRITHDPIVAADVLAAVGDPDAGAVATFLGTTRRHNAGRRVTRLEYEAFEPMAVREMRRIGVRAKRRWGLQAVAMVHRVGLVPIGETSVLIAVSAGHRDAAFEACRWLIDELKTTVPIWKKEHYRGGTVWIGTQAGGPPLRRRTAKAPG